MEILATPGFWVSLGALTFLEIVLGVDNLLFVSIAVSKLKGAQQARARRFGVWGAMVLRILMLSGVFWIIQLEARPLFSLPEGWAAILGTDDQSAIRAFTAFTLKDLILLAGGIFLLVKGTQEIHRAVRGSAEEEAEAANDFTDVLVQLGLINIVFSVDSVITAIGMTGMLSVMVLAVILSTLVMAFAAEPLGDYIERRPTMKMLALAFILMIGVALVADGLGFHIPRGYLYFAIAFSIGVEMLNIRARARVAK